MVNTKFDRQERLLRERISDFFTSHPERRRAVADLFGNFQARNWTAYVFGGVARDLMFYGSHAKVRDVDIVVDRVLPNELQQIMSRCKVKRRTRFGGLHLEHGGWLFDVWSLADTWAFREALVSQAGFDCLPKTTFLNVEAIAVEMQTPQRRKRQIHSHGFFEGMLEKTVEINLEDNPFPALCVVRSIITAEKLNFAIGPALAKYIVFYGTTITVEEMVNVQLKHYGRVLADCDKLNLCIKSIRTQQRTLPGSKAYLPRIYTQQLSLWDDPSVETMHTPSTTMPQPHGGCCND